MNDSQFFWQPNSWIRILMELYFFFQINFFSRNSSVSRFSSMVRGPWLFRRRICDQVTLFWPLNHQVKFWSLTLPGAGEGQTLNFWMGLQPSQVSSLVCGHEYNLFLGCLADGAIRREQEAKSLELEMLVTEGAMAPFMPSLSVAMRHMSSDHQPSWPTDSRVLPRG